MAADVDTQAIEDTYREAPKALADIADWSSIKLLRKSVSCSPRLRLSFALAMPMVRVRRQSSPRMFWIRIVPPAHVAIFGSRSRSRRVENFPRANKIRRSKTLGEPAVDGPDQITGSPVLAGFDPDPGKLQCCPQLV